MTVETISKEKTYPLGLGFYQRLNNGPMTRIIGGNKESEEDFFLYTLAELCNWWSAEAAVYMAALSSFLKVHEWGLKLVVIEDDCGESISFFRRYFSSSPWFVKGLKIEATLFVIVISFPYVSLNFGSSMPCIWLEGSMPSFVCFLGAIPR